MNPVFKGWDKIPRQNKGTYIVSEKIDGTNAQIYIVDNYYEDLVNDFKPQYSEFAIVVIDNFTIFAASKNKYITIDKDNYGFAAWVLENQVDLLTLGTGRHFGEWAGTGIQKNPHNLDKKTFFLFNTHKWGSHTPNTPKCCAVVPVLLESAAVDAIDAAMAELVNTGSHVGTLGTPEGVIAYNTNTKQYLKATFKSPNGKWEALNGN